MKKKMPKRRALDIDMEAKGFVTPKLAAEILRLDYSSVHRLCDEEKLEHVKVGTGERKRLYVKRDSLKKFLGPETAKLLGV